MEETPLHLWSGCCTKRMFQVLISAFAEHRESREIHFSHYATSQALTGFFVLVNFPDFSGKPFNALFFA
jgi:hypothetical protein